MTTVKFEKKNKAVALVTLDRPQTLNAFTAEMRRDLQMALRQATTDAEVRVIVVTGAGRAFSAGADVREVEDSFTIEDVLNTEYGAFLTVIQASEKPVIAAINGLAAGFGVSLALTCDLRVMSSEAYMMIAFSNIGLVPDGGLSWLITQEIGYARAYQLAIEAEKITAERCLDFGLVNRVTAPDKTLEEALAWADELAMRAPVAMALTKRAFRAAAQNGLRNAMAYEATLQRIAIGTDDCREGVEALLQKRKPIFKGR